MDSDITDTSSYYHPAAPNATLISDCDAIAMVTNNFNNITMASTTDQSLSPPVCGRPRQRPLSPVGVTSPIRATHHPSENIRATHHPSENIRATHHPSENIRATHHPSEKIRTTHHPSETALQLNNLYLETKTGMLGIIEEGLQLKLQMQTLRDDFLQLVNDLGQYEQNRGYLQNHERLSNQLPPAVTDMIGASGTTMSSGRARVRSLYEARKARIRARRAPPQESDSGTWRNNKRQEATVSSVSNSANTDEDKENLFRPLCGSNPHEILSGGPLLKPQVSVNNNLLLGAGSRHPQEPLRAMTWSIKKFLTPIREENPEPYQRPGRHSSRHLHRGARRHSSTHSKSQFREDEERSNKKSRSRPRSCYVTPELLDLSDVQPQSHQSPATRSLHDISQISQISSPHEQVSSADLLGAFHSTFNYPLHSTVNNPTASHLNLSDIRPDEDPSHVLSHETQTTLSEPITPRPHRARHNSRAASPVKSKDDSYMDYKLFNSPAKTTTPTIIATRSTFSPSSYKTPSKKLQAKLCKEHGLHPTFGGPCIFQDSVTFFDDSSCPELDVDENDNTPKVHADTDCDSSYLSECVDDHPFSQDYLSSYEARMRMKRQTGQSALDQPRTPVGLSESDLLGDITRKQLSLEATRASLPDLSGLSTLASAERSESTLHASPTRNIRMSSSSEEEEQDMTLICADPRPMSVSTNEEEESPASNTGMTVPVNSPNITDSTGSSSRPNTDNYDYTDQNNTIIHDTSISNKKPSLIGCLPSRSKIANQRAATTKSLPLIRRNQRQLSPRKKLRKKSRETRSASERAPSVSASTGRTAVSCYSRSSYRHSGQEWDSGCSVYSSRPHSSSKRHFTDNTGRHRTIAQSPNKLQHDRKKALTKKIRHFSDSFYRATSSGDLDIETLGHF